MHTVAGATSIAGLKKWAAQQQPSADGAAPHQYVAVASDACNIEFDFLGSLQGQTHRRASGRAGYPRLEPLSRWHKVASALRSRATAVLGPLRCRAASPGASPGRRPKR
jgi:hypothetical protein